MKKTSCDREKSYWRRVGVVCFSLILVFTSWVNVQAAFNTDLESVRQAAGYTETKAMNVFGKLVGIVLGFMGVVVLVIILLGGFKWITSGGAEEKIKSAQKLIAAGAVGLLIIASAYAISSFVTSKVVDTGGVILSNADCTAARVGHACYNTDKVDGVCGQTVVAGTYGCLIPTTSCTAGRLSQACYSEGTDKAKVTGTCGKTAATSSYGCVIPIGSCNGDTKAALNCYDGTTLDTGKYYNKTCYVSSSPTDCVGTQ